MASSCRNQRDHRFVTHCRSNSLYSLRVYEPHEKRGAKKRNRDDDGDNSPHEKRRSKKRKRVDDGDNSPKLQSQATTTQKEEQQHGLHTPTVDLPTIEEEPAPYIIVVQGPPNVGKTTLIKSLVKYYTKQHLNDVQGPVTVVLGELRRIQFVECPNDVNGMIDAAKYADLVLLLVDADFGYEMETFEFLNLLQVHGFSNVAGVLTHLDEFKDEEKRSEAKQHLGRQFWKEIYDGAELFYLSQLNNGMYQDCQIHKLASFILAMKFYPLSWRAAQPYMLVDRFEDVTPLKRVHIDKKCVRNIILYGYLRGCNMKRGTKVHVAGLGDFPINGITSLADPCSLLSAAKMKGVNSKERLFYAPMSDLGNLFCGKYTEYVETPKHSVLLSNVDENEKAVQKGTYVRLEIHDVSFEIAENFDPCHPILVGGISHEEEKLGYLQARLKRHSWHEKLLKTRDPIVVSVGWRRYETRPIYAMEDDGDRFNQPLHYTPWDKYCLAMFWGPLTAPTGLVAVHNAADNEGVFRILATGVVLDSNQAAKIVVKSKRIKAPYEIFEKTALTDKRLQTPQRRRAVVFVEKAPSFWTGSKELELSKTKPQWKKIPKVEAAWSCHDNGRLIRSG
ncbi:hypothetical protein MKW92_040513 [Papaver armeniacum]|nr:hypothetical protein MKW92_040513 [Papaver armeniacum]